MQLGQSSKRLVLVGVKHGICERLKYAMEYDTIHSYDFHQVKSLAECEGSVARGDVLVIGPELLCEKNKNFLAGSNFLVVSDLERLGMIEAYLVEVTKPLGAIFSTSQPFEIYQTIIGAVHVAEKVGQLEREIVRLRQENVTDDLTGLYNMKGFYTLYSKEVAACKNGSHGLGVAMLDLDFFKKVNDNFNHLVGSMVLGKVGYLFKEILSKHPEVFAARYGGDEFVFCMRYDSFDASKEVMNTIRKSIAESVFVIDDFEINVTASLGLVWVGRDFKGPGTDLLKAADVMLYESKKQGRNQLSSCLLSYPIDFDHVGRTHRVDRDSGSDNDTVSFFNNINAL